MDAQYTYARLSGLAIIYGVLIAGLSVSAIGDHAQVMNVYAWYAPQWLVVVMLVWDHNPYGVRMRTVDPLYVRLVRFAGVALALAQDVGFLGWAASLWAKHPQQPVWPATVGVLIPTIVVAAAAVLVALHALMPCYGREHRADDVELARWAPVAQAPAAPTAIRPEESV
jgi:hypothetical protein